RRMLLIAGAGGRASRMADDFRSLGLDANVLSAAAGLTGAIAAQRPDLILVDLLSFHHGLEASAAVQTARAAARGAGVPLMLLAGTDALQLWDLLLAADDFVLDPARPAEVLARAALLTLRSGTRLQEREVVAGR